jgi:hypothetical protein
MAGEDGMMATDNTVHERVAKYKKRQRERGMVLVQVWVPTEAHANEIKRIAAKMRRAEKEKPP